jgi:hypothetical protein
MHFYLNIFILIYINDILIFLQSTKKHVKHVKLILKRLRKFNLFVKFNKCSFHISHVTFLDFRMSLDDILMQKNRIVVVKKWSLLKSYKNVQFFIKFANFYRCLMYNFFWVLIDLTSLFKKDEKNKFKIKFVFISKKNRIDENAQASFHERINFALLWTQWRVNNENKRLKFRYRENVFSARKNRRSVTFDDLLF